MADLTGKGMDQGALYAYLVDLTALVNEIAADIGTIATFQAALTAKLDADVGVTDADYASTLVEAVDLTAADVALTGLSKSE